MRVQEQVDEQRLDRGAVVADLVVAVGIAVPCSSRFSVLLPATGAQRPPRLQPAKRHPEHRVVTQPSWSIRSS